MWGGFERILINKIWRNSSEPRQTLPAETLSAQEGYNTKYLIIHIIQKNGF